MRREIVSAVFPLLLPLFFFFLLVSRSLLFRYLASATTLRPAVESRSNVFSSRLNFTLARPGSGRRLSPADALRYTAIGCAIYPRSANTQPEIAESWSSYRSASFERKASDCPTVHGSRYTYRFAFGDEIGSERRRRRRRRGIALDDSSSISKVRKSVIDPARTGAIYDIQHMIFDLCRISVTVSGTQLRERSIAADRACEAGSRQHDVRVPSREWSRRRRVSGGAAQSLRRYVPFFLSLSLFSHHLKP